MYAVVTSSTNNCGRYFW